MQAARSKGAIIFEDHRVMIFQDLSTEFFKERKRFDAVKFPWAMKIDSGLIYNTKFRLFHKGILCLFIDLLSVETLIKDLETQMAGRLMGLCLDKHCQGRTLQWQDTIWRLNFNFAFQLLRVSRKNGRRGVYSKTEFL